MSPPGPTQAPDKTIGFTEFLTQNNTTYKRRKGTETWKLVDSDLVSDTNELDYISSQWFTLHLARFNQYPEEPLHWSIVISPTNEQPQSRGECVASIENADLKMTFVLEVRGEPEQMFYVDQKTDRPVSLLEDLHSSYELATLSYEESKIVLEVAKNVKPPAALSKREAKENCQGWCIRVVEELVLHGLVKKE